MLGPCTFKKSLTLDYLKSLVLFYDNSRKILADRIAFITKRLTVVASLP